jgi:hypothetical protein
MNVRVILRFARIDDDSIDGKFCTEKGSLWGGEGKRVREKRERSTMTE